MLQCEGQDTRQGQGNPAKVPSDRNPDGLIHRPHPQPQILWKPGLIPKGGLSSAVSSAALRGALREAGRPWTHHALVGLLTRVYPHVDEQLVAGIEGLVAAHAASPEASEVFAFALIDVALLDVPHQLLLLLVGCATVHPAACLLPGHHPAGQAKP